MRCPSMISIPLVAAKLAERLPLGVAILAVDDLSNSVRQLLRPHHSAILLQATSGFVGDRHLNQSEFQRGI